MITYENFHGTQEFSPGHSARQPFVFLSSSVLNFLLRNYLCVLQYFQVSYGFNTMGIFKFCVSMCIHASINILINCKFLHPNYQFFRITWKIPLTVVRGESPDFEMAPVFWLKNETGKYF